MKHVIKHTKIESEDMFANIHHGKLVLKASYLETYEQGELPIEEVQNRLKRSINDFMYKEVAEDLKGIRDDLCYGEDKTAVLARIDALLFEIQEI